ncbi:hypothetical protein ACN27F_25775 [Solwaraspora sp. WMMB335]|uniref:hypothetical protein n=1 Tax=Solwaraspora sp. WMMB335 TaxID=3404118 RepID=UPI003B94435A
MVQIYRGEAGVVVVLSGVDLRSGVVLQGAARNLLPYATLPTDTPYPLPALAAVAAAPRTCERCVPRACRPGPRPVR